MTKETWRSNDEVVAVVVRTGRQGRVVSAELLDRGMPARAFACAPASDRVRAPGSRSRADA